MITDIGAEFLPAGAGTYGKDLRIIFPEKAEAEILIPAEICCCIVGRRSAQNGGVWLIHKFYSGNGNTIVPAVVQEKLQLTGIPGSVRVPYSVTVGRRDQQFAVCIFYEIQKPVPLVPGKNAVEAFRHLSAGMAVKIVIGGGSPGTADPDIGRPQGFSQIQSPLVLKIRRGKHFQERAHLGQIGKLGNFFFTFYLCGGIEFPESASGYFSHFYIVGDQPAVHFP